MMGQSRLLSPSQPISILVSLIFLLSIPRHSGTPPPTGRGVHRVRVGDPLRRHRRRPPVRLSHEARHRPRPSSLSPFFPGHSPSWGVSGASSAVIVTIFRPLCSLRFSRNRTCVILRGIRDVLLQLPKVTSLLHPPNNREFIKQGSSDLPFRPLSSPFGPFFEFYLPRQFVGLFPPDLFWFREDLFWFHFSCAHF